jgi:hypothetical protein
LARESGLESESDRTDRAPSDAVCANRFVLDAVVAKKFVEVALPRVTFPFAVREPPTFKSPALSNVLVAVLPKYALPVFEKFVVEAAV